MTQVVKDELRSAHSILKLGDGDRYVGQTVALASFKDNTVIAHGDRAIEVHVEAKALGYEDPVMLYVPWSHEYCFY